MHHEPVVKRHPRWEDFFRPIEHPPSDELPIHAPVRDDTHLGDTEDLDREPDGIPHAVVGLTAFFAVMLAVLLAFVLMIGTTTSRIGILVLGALAIPVVISGLKRKADRDRDHVHPSR